jgi:hypothetical protein
MASKENLNENLHKPISGIFAKKFMGPHCNALRSIDGAVRSKFKKPASLTVTRGFFKISNFNIQLIFFFNQQRK